MKCIYGVYAEQRFLTVICPRHLEMLYVTCLSLAVMLCHFLIKSVQLFTLELNFSNRHGEGCRELCLNYPLFSSHGSCWFALCLNKAIWFF